MKEVKQVIIMRKDLGMTKGKMMAQAAHASLAVFFQDMHLEYGLNTVKNNGAYKYVLWLPSGSLGDQMHQWIQGSFTKIGLKCESEEELLHLYMKAKAAELPVSKIIDNGLTHFKGILTWTCIAIGPAWSEDIDKITENLSLY